MWIQCDANPLPAEDEDPGPDPFAGQRRHASLRHGDIVLWMRVRIALGSAAGHVGRVVGYAPDAGGMSWGIVSSRPVAVYIDGRATSLVTRQTKLRDRYRDLSRGDLPHAYRGAQ